MINRRKGNLRVLGLNRQASIEAQLFKSALEDFANLGDSFEEFVAFTNDHREAKFWPAEFRKATDLNNPGAAMGWILDKTYHRLTLIYRDYLRQVWRGGEEVHYQQMLRILLGLA